MGSVKIKDITNKGKASRPGRQWKPTSESVSPPRFEEKSDTENETESVHRPRSSHGHGSSDWRRDATNNSTTRVLTTEQARVTDLGGMERTIGRVPVLNDSAPVAMRIGTMSSSLPVGSSS